MLFFGEFPYRPASSHGDVKDKILLVIYNTTSKKKGFSFVRTAWRPPIETSKIIYYKGRKPAFLSSYMREFVV